MPKRSTLAWLWTTLILALCWLPKSWLPVPEGGPEQPSPVPLDKLVHFTLFAVFAVLWARAIPKQGFARLGFVFLAGLALATISEAGQDWSYIGRDANVEDGIADMIGVVSGLVGFASTSRIFKAPSAGTP